MLAKRSFGTKRSLTLLGALLATSAFTVPAYAQIETVVVQAEKKSEDLQTVPIAVTAISGDDLKQKSIITFKDLQFNVPNLTFAKTGLGSGVVFIRGIGQAAGDPGVAQYHDGIFSETNDLAAGTYFDLESVEVLRGPQGTLYGRGSVGGTINLISAKPQMDEFSAKGEATYGEFGTEKGEAAVNIPVIGDTLAVRVAGQYLKHDGYFENISPGQKDQNGQDVYALRGSVRWQPNDRTTLDIQASYFNETDTRTRGDNTLCSRDPTGVLGCLPDGLALEPSNAYANALGIETSAQFMTNFLRTNISPLLAGFGALTSITNLQVLNGVGSQAAIAGDIPQDVTKINTAFTPVFHENQTNIYGHFHHDINDWLKVDFLAGYGYQNRRTTNSYNNLPTEDVSARLATAIPSFFTLLGFLPTPVLPADKAARIQNLASEYFGYGPGMTPPATFVLPLSNPVPGGSANYTVGPNGGIQKFTTGSEASDYEVSLSNEKSAELRFSTDFTGPLNFTGGLFAWHRNSPSAYYRVTFSGGDYFSLFAANLFAGGLGLPGTEPYQAVEPMYYQNAPSDADSLAAFGDVTYEAIPDVLTFRAGLRWSQDTSHLDGDHTSFTGLQSPTPNVGFPVCFGFCILPASGDAGLIQTEATAIFTSSGTYTNHQDNLFDYRLVGEWKPKLDFTDSTMIYTSFSQGTKPGNVNLIPAAVSVAIPGSDTFKPEILKSLEIGTKNTLLDGTLQLNADAWFYDYKNFQYTVIAYSTLFTQNFGAHLWGQELEMVWQPDEHFAMNLNVTNSDSSIANDFAVDARNPTGGNPNAVLIKDIGLNALGDLPGNNCVVMTNTGMSPADDPAVTAAFGGTNPFFAPAGGSTALAAHNVAFANFGNCTTNWSDVGAGHVNLSGSYHYAGPADGTGSNTTGIAVSLKGNHVLNLPPNTITAGMQYTFDFDGGMTLVPRVDYYWQNGYFSRVFNDPVDSVGTWDQLNASIQLNGEDSRWYLKVFATNIMDKKSFQAKAPASDTSGLYTTVFLEDPRIVGITLGAHW